MTLSLRGPGGVGGVGGVSGGGGKEDRPAFVAITPVRPSRVLVAVSVAMDSDLPLDLGLRPWTWACCREQ